MNNKDEVEYLNKARARAEYLATAKKRLETAPVDELLMLVKKGSGEIAMLAGEEITNRIERRLTQDAVDERFAVCKVIMHEYHNGVCISCGKPEPARH